MNSQKKTQQIIQDNHLHRRIIAFLVFLSVCAGFIMPYMGISPGFAETNGVYFESQQKTIPDGAAQLQENMSLRIPIKSKMMARKLNLELS